MSNSINGKLLYNARRRDTETKLVTNEKRFDELSCNPRLKQWYPIVQHMLITKLSFYTIELKYPLIVEWQVIEISKAYMYNLYYNVLKAKYDKDVNLVYMDTHNFLLEFKNVDLHEEMKNRGLKALMDFRNFPLDHDLHSDEKKGELGLIKSSSKHTYCGSKLPRS